MNSNFVLYTATTGFLHFNSQKLLKQSWYFLLGYSYLSHTQKTICRSREANQQNAAYDSIHSLHQNNVGYILGVSKWIGLSHLPTQFSKKPSNLKRYAAPISKNYFAPQNSQTDR